MLRPIALLLALAVPAAAQDFTLPQTAADTNEVYFLAQIRIQDPKAFQDTYIPGVSPLLTEARAWVPAVTPAPTVLEGEWPTNWTVLMRFDDRAAWDAFYESDAYQADLVPLQKRIADVNILILLPAFDPATFGQ